MKISKIRLDILFTLLILIGIISFSVARYQTEVLAKAEKHEEIKHKIEIELKEVQLTAEEQETLDLINEYRKENGLSELKALSNLQEVAKIKGEDLVNNNYFAHNSPNLGTPFEMLKDNNIEYAIAGENLAGNTTPKRAVQAWINSEAHRENILESKFEYTGICSIESPVYGRIYVQIFMGI